MSNTTDTIQAVVNPVKSERPIHIDITIRNLERNNFIVHYFENKEEAVNYLQQRIKNKTVALGDSRTLQELKLYETLQSTNIKVNDIHRPLPGESFRDTALRTMQHDVFLTSVNALSQTGELVKY